MFVKSRFMYIIRSDAGQPLRDELAKSPQKILASAFPEFLPKSDVVMTPGPSSTPAAILGDESLVTPLPDSSNPASAPSSATSEAYFQGLALIKTLVKLIPGWLQSNHIVFDTLVLVWKSPARISRLHKEQELNLVQVSLVLFTQVVKFLLFCCFFFLVSDFQINFYLSLISKL
jgi:transformation/transcription domain-associated protein